MGWSLCDKDTVFLLLSLFPASLLPLRAGVPAIGVGQPATSATAFRLTVAFDPSGRLPVGLASFAICDPAAFPTVGVGQPATSATACKSPPPLCVRPSSCFRSALSAPPVTVRGVGQPASHTSRPSSEFKGTLTSGFAPSFQSRVVVVVGHPDKVQSLADMRAAKPRSAQIARPDGVVLAFQVSRYKIEPAKSVLARNLLAKHDWRAALADEVEPMRP